MLVQRERDRQTQREKESMKLFLLIPWLVEYQLVICCYLGEQETDDIARVTKEQQAVV